MMGITGRSTTGVDIHINGGGGGKIVVYHSGEQHIGHHRYYISLLFINILISYKE